MDSIRIDSNMKLQVVVFATSAVALNVGLRTERNGIVSVPLDVPIVSSRITTDGVANYFYFNFYGNEKDIFYLLNVLIGLSTAGIQRGQCFVRVGLTIGGDDGIAKNPFRILFSDYLTSNSFLTYPGSNIKSSFDGRGFVHGKVIAVPSAGQEFTFAFLSTTVNRIIGIEADLSTDATVLNRVYRLKDVTKNIFLAGSSINQAASNVYDYRCFEGFPNFQKGSDVTLPFPANFITDSVSFSSITTSIQAGDQWITIHGVVYVEQWIKA